MMKTDHKEIMRIYSWDTPDEKRPSRWDDQEGVLQMKRPNQDKISRWKKTLQMKKDAPNGKKPRLMKRDPSRW